MLTATFNEYIVYMAEGLPGLYDDYCRHARLVEEIDLKGAQGMVHFVAVKKRFDWPFLVVAQHYSPSGYAGFYPGALIVPETHLLFIGAGTRLLAYRLDQPERLWEDKADVGFWNWERHGEFVIMSAELELAAWDIHGVKRWSTFVEPPWDYTIEGDLIYLDVMGKQSAFPLKKGRPYPQQ